ncbi:hypothetical protein Pst134EB_012268 [Puccinia striiformis f. sp. tritici]|nr:hypothetical protein Pst134EB_012268 [Puccinia striiformis f. sp. tritici]
MPFSRKYYQLILLAVCCARANQSPIVSSSLAHADLPGFRENTEQMRAIASAADNNGGVLGLHEPAPVVSDHSTRKGEKDVTLQEGEPSDNVHKDRKEDGAKANGPKAEKKNKKDKKKKAEKQVAETTSGDPFLGFISHFKTVRDSPDLKAKIDSMAIELETVRSLLEKGRKSVMNTLPTQGMLIDHKWGSENRKLEEGRKEIEHGEELLQKATGIPEKEAKENSIAAANKLIAKGTQRVREGEEGLKRREELLNERTQFLAGRGKFVEIFEQEIEPIFNLIEAGSRMEALGQISSEERSNLMKHVYAGPSNYFNEGKQSSRGASKVEEGSEDFLKQLPPPPKALSKELSREDSRILGGAVPEEVSSFVKHLRAIGIDLEDPQTDFKLNEEYIAKALADILHNFGRQEIRMGDNFNKAFDPRMLMLQRVIFKMMNYMYRNGNITKQDYQEFLQNKNTLEILGIIIFIPSEFSLAWNSHLTTQYVLLDRGEPALAKDALEVLDEKSRASLHYFYLKSIFSYFDRLNVGLSDLELRKKNLRDAFLEGKYAHGYELLAKSDKQRISKNEFIEGLVENEVKIQRDFIHLRDSIFGADNQFLTSLQKYLQAKLVSVKEKERFEETEQFHEMKTIITNTFTIWAQIGDQHSMTEAEKWQLRFVFIYIKFIEDTLGKEFIEEIQISPEIMKRFKIMSLRFKFFAETDQIKLYIQDKLESVPVPEFVLNPKDSKADPPSHYLDYVIHEYIPKMFENNKERVARLTDGESLLNYQMLGEDVNLLDTIKRDIGPALVYSQGKKTALGKPVK